MWVVCGLFPRLRCGWVVVCCLVVSRVVCCWPGVAWVGAGAALVFVEWALVLTWVAGVSGGFILFGLLLPGLV